MSFLYIERSGMSLSELLFIISPATLTLPGLLLASKQCCIMGRCFFLYPWFCISIRKMYALFLAIFPQPPLPGASAAINYMAGNKPFQTKRPFGRIVYTSLNMLIYGEILRTESIQFGCLFKVILFSYSFRHSPSKLSRIQCKLSNSIPHGISDRELKIVIVCYGLCDG